MGRQGPENAPRQAESQQLPKHWERAFSEIAAKTVRWKKKPQQQTKRFYLHVGLSVVLWCCRPLGYQQGQMRCLWIQLTGGYYEKYITKHNFHWAIGSINLSLKVNPFAAAATAALPSFNSLAAICNCFVPWVEWMWACGWTRSRHWSELVISGAFATEIIFQRCRLG